MGNHQVRDPDYSRRVRDSFERQAFMAFIGAELTVLEPGHCEIELPYRAELSQQHGFFHGGVIGTLADNACGYAAYTLTPADASILPVEYKLNIVAPGDGERLIARGEVVKAGRTLSVTEGRVYAVKGGVEKLCAIVTETLLPMADTSDDPKFAKKS